ncbi:hypothetical protein Vadar_016984 [Vaccinium darrowii]|uniref:Uncharacterized protein n=1 Tax=Vaccinium darrowii TaxID=229202 RepID=A0ACB7YMP7_9ERIC|nr:hypothetical protein Vadar_016984 [Vaccinium darrowii]
MKPQTSTNTKATATVPPTGAKAGDATPTLYEDFEPLCRWLREEGKETLVVHVQEFKRDQMKVHVSNRGTLRITGERPLDGTKRSRFTKEIKIPQDCSPNDITARFTNAGLLHVVMPKKTAPIELQEAKQDHQPTQVVQQPQAQTVPPKPEPTRGDQVAEKTRMGLEPVAEPLTRAGKAVMGVARRLPPTRGVQEARDQTEPPKPTQGDLVAEKSRMGFRDRKVVIGVALAVVVAVVVALGALAAYSYKHRADSEFLEF